MGLLLSRSRSSPGRILPLQAGINARLADYVGGPVRASFASFAIGALVLLAVILLFYRGGNARAFQHVT